MDQISGQARYTAGVPELLELDHPLRHQLDRQPSQHAELGQAARPTPG